MLKHMANIRRAANARGKVAECTNGDLLYCLGWKMGKMEQNPISQLPQAIFSGERWWIISPYDCGPYPVQWDAPEQGKMVSVITVPHPQPLCSWHWCPCVRAEHLLKHTVQGFACSLATGEPKPGSGWLCSRIWACSICPQRKRHSVFSFSFFCTDIP